MKYIMRGFSCKPDFFCAGKTTFDRVLPVEHTSSVRALSRPLARTASEWKIQITNVKIWEIKENNLPWVLRSKLCEQALFKNQLRHTIALIQKISCAVIFVRKASCAYLDSNEALRLQTTNSIHHPLHFINQNISKWAAVHPELNTARSMLTIWTNIGEFRIIHHGRLTFGNAASKKANA